MFFSKSLSSHCTWGFSRFISQLYSVFNKLFWTRSFQSTSNDEAMVVPQGYQQRVQRQQGPSCWDKLKMGFMMGCMIGGSTGIIIGGFSLFRLTAFQLSTAKAKANFRSGLRGREALRQVGKTAAQMGGSFGIFMAVAQGLRC
jgi:hypothetical protein